MDDGALKSASILYKHVYFSNQGDAPCRLPMLQAEPNVLGATEIFSQYVPRTTLARTGRRSVTFKEAEEIESMFRALRGRVEGVPNYDRQAFDAAAGRKCREAPRSFACMEQCWFKPLYKSIDDMRKEEAERERKMLLTSRRIKHEEMLERVHQMIMAGILDLDELFSDSPKKKETPPPSQTPSL